MPVSSVIVGVDLVPIKPINNVITLTEDITTASCRSAIKQELKTWKADLVLNDGAPNVGKSWTHDAFQQNCLTLSALELATEFLMPNGTFVTKVFRSKDYQALLWVLGKLFRKVSATKPAASRNESAEIFIVAQKYLAPDKIDSKFFSPNYLFEDAVNEELEAKKSKINLLKPVAQQKRPKAEGYKDGESLQFFTIKVSDFIRSSNHLEALSKAHEIVFDDDEVSNHPLTTFEIKECCKDIKVLGRKEILSLIRWRNKMRTELGVVKKKEETNEEEIEEESLDEADEEAKRQRKRMRKVLKARKKEQERRDLKMVIKNDQLVEENDIELFSLSKIKNKKILKDFEEFSMSEGEGDDEDDKPLPRFTSYDKDSHAPDFEDEEEDDENGDDDEDDDDMDESEDEISKNGKKVAVYESDEEDDLGIINSFQPKDKKTELFFKKGILSEFLKDDDSDDDDQEIMETLDDLNVEDKSKKKTKPRKNEESSEDDDSSEDESQRRKKLHPKCQTDIKLDPESLALAEEMIGSSKRKRDIMDEAWNRYTRGDEDAPSWFRKDEEKYWRKAIQVNPEALKRYREQQKELNVRPIKKVAEAKARKKKRVLQRMEKERKRAEAITDTPDMTDKEKAAQLKNLYKKSMQKQKKKEVTYVVAKKGASSQRPQGLKGKYKVVDRRMKKDNRKTKMTEKKGKKGSKGKGSSAGGKKKMRGRS